MKELLIEIENNLVYQEDTSEVINVELLKEILEGYKVELRIVME